MNKKGYTDQTIYSEQFDWFEDVFFIIFILLQNRPWFTMISIAHAVHSDVIST